MISDSFLDELEKIALSRSTIKKMLGYGGAGAALGFGGGLAHHFGLLDGAMGATGGGGGHDMGDLIGPQGAEGRPDVRSILHKELGIDGSGFKGLGGSGSAARDALDSLTKAPDTGHVNNVLGRGTGHMDGLAADNPSNYAGGKNMTGHRWPESGSGAAGDMGGGGSMRRGAPSLSALSRLLRR